MRILLAIATLALITTSAEAKVHEIKLGGRTTRIEVPANCKKISCVSVLGSEKSGSRSKKKTEPKSVAAPVAAAVAAPAAAAAVVAPQPAQPAPVAKVEPKVEPQADTQAADDRKPIARLTLPTPADEPKTVVANAMTAPTATDRIEPAKVDPASPVGLWLTQKREGKIRIEPCGDALCGFADGKPSDKVLIDMKPGSNNRWNGKIKDTRSGSVYASHISLKGPNSLSVQGCAFGGMFCGGETWTRAE
jgi:uncharacterized protein (DUF2147 family)